MSHAFFRFPHTPHLVWLGEGKPRDDKVLAPAEAKELLAGEVIVEEKLDGANLGLSVNHIGQVRAQSGGQYLVAPYGGQFARLTTWLMLHGDTLAAKLNRDWIVFGEWCSARHSLTYDCLPDWWLVFDIYDRERGYFLPASLRNAWATDMGFSYVPEMLHGRTNLRALLSLLAEAPSHYRRGLPEGFVIRKESRERLLARAKLVRAEFTQAIDDHWRSRRIEWNRLALRTPWP